MIEPGIQTENVCDDAFKALVTGLAGGLYTLEMGTGK